MSGTAGRALALVTGVEPGAGAAVSRHFAAGGYVWHARP